MFTEMVANMLTRLCGQPGNKRTIKVPLLHCLFFKGEIRKMIVDRVLGSRYKEIFFNGGGVIANCPLHGEERRISDPN